MAVVRSELRNEHDELIAVGTGTYLVGWALFGGTVSATLLPNSGPSPRPIEGDASGVRLKEVEQQLARLTRLQGAEPKVEEVCRMIRTKLAVMTFDGKRLAMEALGAQVWVYPDKIDVRGLIPSFLTIERTSASPRGCSRRCPPGG